MDVPAPYALTSRRFAAAAFVLLAAAALYGFFHERLFAEQVWTADGRVRLLLYSVVYWAAASGLLLFAPRWLGMAAAGFALIYSIWWCGPAAPFAALYFLGSCLLLGRMISRRADAATSILLGMSAWMFAIWIALHFPVNTRAAYAAVMALPYAWEVRRWREHVRGFTLFAESRKAAAALALLLFVLMAHWLISLKPEISDDGLSMHLALPMMVAHNARWGFDFRHYTWALMPAGGDCIFTAAYLLGGPNGGEAAARLVNFALLVLIAVMIVQASRRWLASWQAFLAAALFASTPLAELVTGSLFVENVWAALILSGSLAILRYNQAEDSEDLRNAGILFGSALAVKLIAAVFAVPAALAAGWFAARHKRLHALIPAAVLFAFIAAPPYLYALIKSGNPVFPFENTIFKSPSFDTSAPFVDGRFVQPLSWRTPYDATFRSAEFLEAQGGAVGFQYFLLLIPALLVLRKCGGRLFFGIGGAAAAALFAVVPNLRYLYPVLPLFSIVIAGLLAEWGRIAAGVFLSLTALNMWFLSASGWYHKDFALFRRSEVKPYLATGAPERELIDDLNRQAPGEPAAFFFIDEAAGLNAQAYIDNWHSYQYWSRLLAARDTATVAAILREFGIRQIVAPVSFHTRRPVLDNFLHAWAAPTGESAGNLGLFRLRDAAIPLQIRPFSPGPYDDLDSGIEYTGAWIHDDQFSQAANGSVTYSDVAKDSLQFSFAGSGITYVFTKALNRGIALVLIDGAERARIDMYSPETKWRFEAAFDGLGGGKHEFEVRVLGSKNPRSSGTFVDMDGIVVRP